MHLKQNVFLIFFSPKIKMRRNFKKNCSQFGGCYSRVRCISYGTTVTVYYSFKCKNRAGAGAGIMDKGGVGAAPQHWKKLYIFNFDFFSLLFSIFFHFYGPCDFLKMKIADFLDLGPRESNSPGIYHFCIRQFMSFLLFLPHSS